MALPLESVLLVSALWIRSKPEGDVSSTSFPALFNVVHLASLLLTGIRAGIAEQQRGSSILVNEKYFDEAFNKAPLRFQREEMLCQNRSSLASLAQVLPHSP